MNILELVLWMMTGKFNLQKKIKSFRLKTHKNWHSHRDILISNTSLPSPPISSYILSHIKSLNQSIRACACERWRKLHCKTFFPFFTFILTFQMLEEVRDLSAISENFFRNHKVTYLSQHKTSSKIELHHLMIARKKTYRNRPRNFACPPIKPTKPTPNILSSSIIHFTFETFQIICFELRRVMEYFHNAFNSLLSVMLIR